MSVSSYFKWTEERIALLTKRWEGGVPALAIAAEFRTTKNAVVGKAHRLRLTARPSPIKVSDEPKPASDPVPVRLVAMPYTPPRTVAARTCQFPLWPHTARPKDYTFCDATSVQGSSYCAGHLAVCTTRRPMKIAA